MFTHQQIWAAIDAVAEAQGLSASALARRAGLDATALNRSKRITPDGRVRWPSTETLSKLLTAAGMDLRAWVDLMGAVSDLAVQDTDQAKVQVCESASNADP